MHLVSNRPSRKAWPDEAGREGGEREVGRGVAVAGPGHSDRSCSQAGLQRTKGDGATITHETGEGGKERERERGRVRDRDRREGGEGERERERYTFSVLPYSVSVFSFSFIDTCL